MVHKLLLNACIYMIWKERNERKYGNSKSSANETLHHIVNVVKEKMATRPPKMIDTPSNKKLCERLNFQATTVPNQSQECHWEKPPEDTIMINVDGAYSDDKGSYEVILKDCNGKVLAAGGGVALPWNTVGHELQAIRAGLTLALDRQDIKVIISSDSLSCVNYINEEDVPWQYLNLVREIKRMMALFQSCIIKHIWRETNRAADHIATLFFNSMLVILDVHSIDNTLSRIVQEDADGQVYYRQDGQVYYRQ